MITHVPIRAVLGALILLTLSLATGEQASAEQASAPPEGRIEAGLLDVGRSHSCTVLAAGSVRCWGFGGDGRLGYGNLETIGDSETPGSVGPVQLGQGATAISTGGFHSCALLSNAGVRCWGYAEVGALGYGNKNNIGDDENPDSAGPVNLGAGRTAQAITAGQSHTCAILNLGDVRCWGLGLSGALGVGASDIGDDETPDSLGPVDLGPGRAATAITAGTNYTCAILDNGSVRCWGSNAFGKLGSRPGAGPIGDGETPGSVPPVNLGDGRTARAISAGENHTCAILDNGSVRCWGANSVGQLGYGNTEPIGDDETPDAAGPVNLGEGRTAKAISAGDFHTCALLDNGSIRCWGWTLDGRLGYGRLEFGGLNVVGDNETPASVGPVDLGAGRTATAISAGQRHTCARLDDGSVRCWGYGAVGALGSCSQASIGDNETPASVGPVALTAPPGGGTGCTRDSSLPPPAASPSEPDPAAAALTSEQPAPAALAPSTPQLDPAAAALSAQSARRRGLRGCLADARRHTTRETRAARRLSGARRMRARRHAKGHSRQMRSRCMRRYARTPGPIARLSARSVSSRQVALTFLAAGTDGSGAPPARSYLVKQSRRPIRNAHDFNRAQTLCNGSCRFPVSAVGAHITLTVTGLRPHTTHHFAVRARDNVSGRLGPRSTTIAARTR